MINGCVDLARWCSARLKTVFSRFVSSAHSYSDDEPLNFTMPTSYKTLTRGSADADPPSSSVPVQIHFLWLQHHSSFPQLSPILSPSQKWVMLWQNAQLLIEKTSEKVAFQGRRQDSTNSIPKKNNTSKTSSTRSGQEGISTAPRSNSQHSSGRWLISEILTETQTKRPLMIFSRFIKPWLIGMQKQSHSSKTWKKLWSRKKKAGWGSQASSGSITRYEHFSDPW